MTKYVRIENADTSKFILLVHVQDKTPAGEWVTGRIERLEYPTEMLREVVHGRRRIIIEEGGEMPE